MLTTPSPVAQPKSKRASSAEPASVNPPRAPGITGSIGTHTTNALTRQPVGAAEFASLMDSLGPFETSPALAVAVSGGADSIALCLLAHEWAEPRGGTVTGLTVDHGLRAGSSDEADLVGDWLRAQGIGHRVLPWRGEKPRNGVQSKARDARYGLLRDWCLGHGVLHLLVAHHADDQAETLLMRADRASGFDGLAGMAALVDTDAPRLLRPLLGLGRARLRASLRLRRQEWIEDPSNRDLRFARARVRADLDGGAWDAVELAGVADRVGRIRAFDEAFTNEWLARYADLHPAGYGWLDLDGLRAAPPGVGLRMLSRMVIGVAGKGYPPRRPSLARVLTKLLENAPRRATLAGCLLTPRGGGVLVCRESRGSLPALVLRPGQPRLWDGRFTVEMGAGGGQREGLRVQALGRRGWDMIAAESRWRPNPVIPSPARIALPALWRGERLLAAPHLGYRIEDGGHFSASFTPLQPFVPPYFAVARARTCTI